MMPRLVGQDTGQLSTLDRVLRLFADVRAGEGRDCLLMFANVFLLLVAYYVLKTVREPLILATGGAELKTYAAAAQAAVLLFYVPAYGYVASRLPPRKLVISVVVFFLACVQLFVVAGLAGISYVGFAFYVWVGIFSLTCIAQFWSFANDIYDKSTGDRVFPLIAIGATAGAPLGAALAGMLFRSGLSPWWLMQLASALLVGHLVLYLTVRRSSASRDKGQQDSGVNGFALVFRSRYLSMIAILLVLLNVVNTTGEYILASLVTEEATALPPSERGAYIGQFYGLYFFWVNLASVTIQAFLVSRLVKIAGMTGALLALPVVALGAYGLAAATASLALVRWIKTAENSVDYSVMNTAKQMLWLPTTREEKYKGKQAIDTFFVRFGDLMAAGVVFVGSNQLDLGTRGFALANLVFVCAAIAASLMLRQDYARKSAQAAAR